MNCPTTKKKGVSRMQTIRFYPFVSSGKERDEETGYGYFSARYMDHELMTMWLSVDPMADKYPSLSPYAYCAWNPVKLVDPDGEECGDYYNLNGTYLGWDGNKKDNVIHIVDNKATLTKDANGNIDPNKTTPLFTTTYETLSAALGVFYRTKTNGGLFEESTLMLSGRIPKKGEKGYYDDQGKPHANIPVLTKEEKELVTASIHSHPFLIMNTNDYYTTIPSTDDKKAFGSNELNIIVGYIYMPESISKAFPNSEENLGAAFFNSSSELITKMSLNSMQRIVNYRGKANKKHK